MSSRTDPHPPSRRDARRRARGTQAGFAHRIVYVQPELIRRALDDRSLPFAPDPVHDRTPATHELARLVNAIDDTVSDLGRLEVAAVLADALCALSGRRDRQSGTIDLPAANRVREYLSAHACDQTPASTLERIAGTDRFTIARHFRRAFGTSPDRYRTLRRLAHVRAAIEDGVSLAAAAAEAGFADQSHMTRQFSRTYGLTPGRWARIVTARPRRTDEPYGSLRE